MARFFHSTEFLAAKYLLELVTCCFIIAGVIRHWGFNMIYFYQFMFFCCDFELAIARRYSSNRDYIRSLSQDVQKWQGLLHRARVAK